MSEQVTPGITSTAHQETPPASLPAPIDLIRAALNRALVGKAEVVELVLACVLARGHLLVDDLPGLGKTTLAKALAGAIGGRFARLQCTPDLLPGDVTGFNIFNQKTREFEFRRGPVFSDVFLCDEINRTTPRTQSALFEAMAECQVTLDGETHFLSDSFLVIATQNPVESHGAYPLPEAQLDRFSMKLRIGYPAPENEVLILASQIGTKSNNNRVGGEAIQPDQLARLQDQVSTVAVSPALQKYIVNLGTATRNHRQLSLGLSPRGLLIWQRVSQAWAFLQGREFVTPDDIQTVALPVLEVRLAGDFESGPQIVEEILSSVEVPLFN